jgi:digeranylgeranylglycerophospholipid reductase
MDQQIQTKLTALRKKTIAIIGAGPIGCYTAHLLARAGHHVEVFEEHGQIGNPIQCTGLLTADFDKYFPELKNQKSEFLVSTLKSVTVKTKHNSITIPQTEYLVCRTKFDQFFGKLAEQSGAKIHLNHSFREKVNGYLNIKDSKNNTRISLKPDIVVAADGPLSKTAKAFNIFHKKRTNYYGIQAVVSGQFNEQNFDVYFGEDYCKDFFVWVVPESSTKARVGLCSKSNSKAIFDKFMKSHSEWKTIEIQAGVIPIFHNDQILNYQNCFVVGDAAGQVKATTLGGLIPGLRAAEKLAESINNHNYRTYQSKSFRIRMELLLHRQIRNVMDKFTDSDWDTLLKLTNQQKVKSVMQKYSRDNPIPLIINLLIKEPRYLRYIKHLI